MPYQNIYLLDRASFLLDAQLLSSLTSGTFTGSSSSVLGTQSWNMPAGYNAIITVEQEQILLSAMSITGGTITCTIATRGYNGTTAATHTAGTVIELHLTKAHFDGLQSEVSSVTQGVILQSVVTTVASASQHTIAGDLTAVFTVGRAYLFKIGSTWYRGVVRSSSYGGGVTTINLTGDGLPASGTVVSAGFEFFGSINKPVDYQLVKEATNVPVDSPPSGYCWLFAKGKAWYLKDSSGVLRRLSFVQASASSSSGVLTLDWSLADIYDCTLTENITSVTHQNGADGETYMLRIKQHASSGKTVALGTSGGTRFSNDISTYAASTDLSAEDILRFVFNATDAKYDLADVIKGFQASPTPASTSDIMYGDGSDGALNVASGTTTLTTDKIYQYQSINVANGATLTIGGAADNKPLVMYVRGNVTIAGTINLSGKGAVGGSGGAWSSPTAGSAGIGYSGFGAGGGGGGGESGDSGSNGGNGNAGSGYTAGSGGAKGTASYAADGAAGGGCVALITGFTVQDFLKAGLIPLSQGAGGGQGGGSSNASNYWVAGGAGGRGGGSIAIICGGAVNISGSINCSGAVGSGGGSNGYSGDSGGGGGGGGGVIVIIYKGTYSLTGTLNVAGGTGGTGPQQGTKKGGDGGTGASGTSVAMQLGMPI